jgi:hypothetical protein
VIGWIYFRFYWPSVTPHCMNLWSYPMTKLRLLKSRTRGALLPGPLHAVITAQWLAFTFVKKKVSLEQLVLLFRIPEARSGSQHGGFTVDILSPSSCCNGPRLLPSISSPTCLLQSASCPLFGHLVMTGRAGGRVHGLTPPQEFETSVQTFGLVHFRPCTSRQ